MASNNGNDNGSSQTPDSIVCDCLSDIKDEKKAAKSAKKASKTARDSETSAKGYNICCLDRAKETHELYQDLFSCVTLEQYKHTEIIQTNIDDYIKKDDAIEKHIADASKLLNELCNKILAANTEFCNMASCINDIVYSKAKKKNRSKAEQDRVKEVTACLEDIQEGNTVLKDKGENAVESVITIGGIQTFTDTAGLKEFGTKFMDSVTALKSCNEDNITSTAEEIAAFRDELNATVQELAQMQCDEAAHATTMDGLEKVIKFICEVECEGECLDLCAEFEDCCKDPGEPPQKSTPKSMKDQN